MQPSSTYHYSTYIIVIFAAVAGAALVGVYFMLQPEQTSDVPTVPDTVEYTYEQKEDVLKQLNASASATSTAPAMPQTEQEQVFQDLRASDTAPSVSDEEKLRILQSL